MLLLMQSLYSFSDVKATAKKCFCYYAAISNVRKTKKLWEGTNYYG